MKGLLCRPFYWFLYLCVPEDFISELKPLPIHKCTSICCSGLICHSSWTLSQHRHYSCTHYHLQSWTLLFSSLPFPLPDVSLVEQTCERNCWLDMSPNTWVHSGKDQRWWWRRHATRFAIPTSQQCAPKGNICHFACSMSWMSFDEHCFSPLSR